MPDISAIYFLEPTKESVAKLIKDFEDLRRPQYRNVHLFFTSGWRDAV